MKQRFITLLAAAVLSMPAAAGEQTWEFTLATDGEDVSWNSPTSVDPAGVQYDAFYVLEQLIVTVQFLGFPIDVDVTDELPPEFLMGGGSIEGPAPITLLDEMLSLPPPPDPLVFEASLFMGIDAKGFGFFNATDITFGSIDVGFGDVPLLGFEVSGSITVTPVYNPADVNGDDAVDVLDLVEVITGWGVCPDLPEPCPADVNLDGMVDVLDLVEVITNWG